MTDESPAATPRAIRESFAACWDKPLSPHDSELLAKRRPKAKTTDWIRAFDGIRESQDRPAAPALKTILESMPVSFGSCQVCGGLRGVTVAGGFLGRQKALEAGFEARLDFRELKNDPDVHLSLGAVKRAVELGLDVQPRTFLAFCDECGGTTGRPNISDCFRPSGAGRPAGLLAGFVRLARIAPKTAESTLRHSGGLVERTLVRAFQAPSAGRGKSGEYSPDEQIGLAQWFEESHKGEFDVRPELVPALAKSSTVEELLTNVGIVR